MKNNSSIFTRSMLGLDNQVWLTMLIISVASILIFGFKAITHVKCTDFEVSASGARQQNKAIFYIGETVNFSTSIPLQGQQEWDFGDGSPTVQTLLKPVSHRFLKANQFHITCTTNGKCQQVVTISVIPTPPPVPIDSVSLIRDGILGVDTLYAGTTGHFTTPIKANYGYQWSVGTSPDVPIQTTASANFTFSKAGKQVVQLKIDGTRSYSKQVIVLPKTPSGLPTGNSLPASPPVIKLPPVISFIDPVSGGPGTHVTIHGSLFAGTKLVTFGGQPAKIISVESDKIVAEISADGATGPVVVQTDNGPGTFANPPFTYILPKRDTAKASSAEPVKQYIRITDKQLKIMLADVVNNKMHAQDFDRYFCSGVNTKVYVNKDNKTITFGALCESHLQGKKIEIESAQISRDPDNPDCVTNLTVKYKKRWDWNPIN